MKRQITGLVIKKYFLFYFCGIGYTMRYMTRRDMRGRSIAVRGLVIKKDVRLKGSQKLGLVHATEKQRFIQPDIPVPQRANHALMSRRTPSGDQGRAYRAFSVRKLLLQAVHGGQKGLKRAAGQGLIRLIQFRLTESLNPCC